MLNRTFRFVLLLQKRLLSANAERHDSKLSFRKIDKVLIANRGEIACRIIRTARQLGIETVAVFSDADRNSLHVSMADEAYHIGPSPAIQSYLVKEKLLEIALKSNSDAIHPGYGFLSENFEFSELCTKNGLIFVGPTPESIKSMGIKSLSKSIMIEAAVPVIPGFHDDNQQENGILLEKAKSIGFPVMIKAVRGGGGKGMRIAMNENEFLGQLDSARREAMKAFGDDVVLLEKFVRRPRHVEVQIFGDKHGNCVHLFERDCSSQRRHQKVIEEAPGPGITPEIREQLGTAAVKAAKAVDYHGAGTVEFIFDCNDQNFYFMEMNTRLQVEHPVTEMITGLDLVEWQLRIAGGEPLPMTQEHFQHPRGHSFEARIYAEDADANFAPCTGTIETLNFPKSFDPDEIRIETGVRQGDEVSVFYDPMIAKLVVWAPDRSAALKKLCQALREVQISGFKTNIDYLLRLALHPKFQIGDVYTDFIAEHQDELKRISIKDQNHINIIRTVATLAFLSKRKIIRGKEYQYKTNDHQSPFTSIEGSWITGCGGIYSSAHIVHLENTFGLDEESQTKTELRVQYLGNSRYLIDIFDSNKKHIETFDLIVDLNELQAENLSLFFVKSGIRKRFNFSIHSERLISVFDHNYGPFTFNLDIPDFLKDTQNDQLDLGAVDDKKILSPMSAVVEKILVKPGDTVRSGDIVVILTAMKMEHIIYAKFDSETTDRVVEQIRFKQGDSVAKNAIIVTFKD
ncbi:putative E3 ubiquitin-protein ligase HERC4-like [Sarcoptes scabiei]|nr:putative E3 ubiquitin-protein ligase HERC4-like [Sarcoptes scabiei]